MCVDNIMDSTNSLETTGNFRLKGLNSMPGSIRLQGFMSLCTNDGLQSWTSITFIDTNNLDRPADGDVHRLFF